MAFAQGATNLLPDHDFADIELMFATGWTWKELQSTPLRIVEKTRMRLAAQAAVRKS